MVSLFSCHGQLKDASAKDQHCRIALGGLVPVISDGSPNRRRTHLVDKPRWEKTGIITETEVSSMGTLGQRQRKRQLAL